MRASGAYRAQIMKDALGREFTEILYELSDFTKGCYDSYRSTASNAQGERRAQIVAALQEKTNRLTEIHTMLTEKPTEGP